MKLVHKKLIKTLCVFLSFVILFAVLVSVVFKINKKSLIVEGNYNTNWQVSNNDSRIGQGYALSSENEKLSLYVDYETGKFYLLDKANGTKWYSTPQNTDQDKISKGVLLNETKSELVFDYISVLDENRKSVVQKASSKFDCLQNGAVAVKDIKNGVRVTYDFKQLEIRIPVEYVLKNNYLETSVVVDEIEDGTKNLLVSLKFLPYFGAAGANDNGYLFIPDGSGAISIFNNGVIPVKSYNKPIYGKDRAYYTNNEMAKSENIIIPVFGKVYDNGSALMGTVTSGEGGASISALAGSKKNYYNTVYPEMMYRIYSVGTALYESNKEKDISTVTHTPFGVDKFSVRYYSLSNDMANYAGMAQTYREYLIEEKNMKQNAKRPALSLDIYGATATKSNAFGVIYNKMRVLTDFSQAEKIINQLSEGGIDNFAVRYFGWNNNGVFNSKMTSKSSPLKDLGGKNGFIILSDYLFSKGYEFYPVVDTVTYSKNGNGLSLRNDSAKSTNGDIAEQNEFSIVTFEKSKLNSWALVKPSKFNEIAEKFLNDYKKLNINSLSISELGEYLYSDFSKSGGIYKAKSVEYVENLLSNTRKSVDNIAVTGGNAYTFSFVDRIYSLPIGSSNYDIFSYDVPFVQMVLHGYVSYTTPYIRQSFDTDFLFLKSLETGSDLLFSCVSDESYPLRDTRLSHLMSSESSLWSDMAVKYYNEYKTVADKVWDSKIAAHQYIENDLFKTQYENGISVYVNYSSSDKTVNNLTVPAKWYVVEGVAR